MYDFIIQHSFVLAQIVGFIAVALVIAMYQLKSHKVIMGMFVLICSLWGLHFALLKCWSAAAMNGINVVRSIIYGLKGEKIGKSPAVPIIFCIISVIMVALTWQDAWNLLTLTGTVAATIANWQTDTRKLKILTVPVSCSWLVYNIHSLSYAGTLNEILALTSIGIYFFRTRKKTAA